MSDTHIQFANLVATPTTSSWSQAYNAGRLFAVFSLAKSEDQLLDETLAAIGKMLVSTLQEEYFTLETKTLASIKTAVSETSQKIPQGLQASFVIGAIVDTVLYAYAYGGAKVLLKRGQKAGLILDTKEQEPSQEDDGITSASGFLKDNDLLVLQTREFATRISQDSVISALQNTKPQDTVETLSPKLHTEEGGASAIFIEYKTPQPDPMLAAKPADYETPQEEPSEESISENKFTLPLSSTVSSFASKIITLPKKLLLPKQVIHLSHRKKILLTIIIILSVLLSSSIYFATKKQEEARIQALFQDVYPKAVKKAEEADGLLSINQILAQEDYQTAKKLLEQNLEKFPKGTKERTEVETLLEKVTKSTQGITASSSPVSEVSPQDNPMLLSLIKTKKRYAAHTDSAFYVADNTSVSSFDTKTQKEKTVIANNALWKQLAGLGVFGTNVYVLDKDAKQILKFQNASAAAKVSYLSTPDPDLSKAISLTIDSSIYVLLSNGTINKYTRGKKDIFTISGLSVPLSSPVAIATTVESDKLYVLEPTKGRIVVLGKTGAFQTQYNADQLRTATALDLKEAEKMILFLSKQKVFSIPL
ncbi:MAG: hypothetical protein HYT10_00975 [Candidatus Levybacteria bacterium]|nr:hypothetical protein [Candidatus Levybacteria bacterium]